MKSVNLSYLLTTRNKLPFLTYGLNRLINNLKSDEEIIVVDAGSNDGTVDFLKNLYKEGKIHQFISESDNGEGHGYNKSILLANGILLKLISDDDFFNFKGIQECKKIMLENNYIDVMIGNTYNTQLDDFDQIYCETEVEDNFKNYVKTGKVFPFTGLSLMIRKNSIAFTGLFLSNITCVDTEFSLRLTSLGANIGWTNAAIAIRIGNPQSNLHTTSKEKIAVEFDRFQYIYNSNYRARKNNIFVIFLNKFKRFIKFFNLFKKANIEMPKKTITNPNKIIEIINKKCESYIVNLNKKKTNFIISK